MTLSSHPSRRGRGVRLSRALLGMMVGLVACDTPTEIAGPLEESDSTPFVQSLDLTGVEEMVLSGPSRVKVKLLPGGLTAALLVVEEEGLDDEESLESRLVALSRDGEDRGSLGLALGDLTVGYDAATRFFLEGDEVDRAHFLEWARSRLDGGHHPAIEVERAPAAEPQDPDDPSFVAAAVDGGGRRDPWIRMNVDGDNLERNADPAEGEPDGWLVVLGLRIELRVSDGTTHLEHEDTDFAEEREFEGVVESVDPAAGSFRLRDGPVIRVVDGTEVRAHDDHGPASLAAVAEALEAGTTVVAWGRGGVESEEPPVLVAFKVTFATRSDGDDGVHREEFEGHVTGAFPADGAFELGDGLRIGVTAETEIVAGDDHGLSSLEAVARALEEGLPVVAFGVAAVESEEPLVLVALRVVFKVRAAEFEGAVGEVDLSNRTLVVGETVVRLGDGTEIVAGDDHGLTSLEAVAEALGGGLEVVAWGHGALVGTEPRTVDAWRITFKVRAEEVHHEEFEGLVAGVEPADGVVELASGVRVLVGGDTEVVAGDDYGLSTLEAVAAALEGGLPVVAFGYGGLESETPVTISAAKVTFKVRSAEFEGVVGEVDLDLRTLVVGETTVRLSDETEVVAGDDHGLTSLEAVAQALTDGLTVVGWGHGVLAEVEPRTVDARKITFKIRQSDGG